MKTITLIHGERANGKTYSMVKKAFESAYMHKNVFIIGENPRFQLYVKHILEKEYPNIKKEYKRNKIIINDEWIMYVITPSDVDNYPFIDICTELYIDDYYTLLSLTQNKKFIETTKNIKDIVVTSSNHFLEYKYRIDDIIKKFRGRIYMKAEWSGYDGEG